MIVVAGAVKDIVPDGWLHEWTLRLVTLSRLLYYVEIAPSLVHLHKRCGTLHDGTAIDSLAAPAPSRLFSVRRAATFAKDSDHYIY